MSSDCISSFFPSYQTFKSLPNAYLRNNIEKSF